MRCPYVTLIYEKIDIEELIFLLLFLRHILCNNVYRQGDYYLGKSGKFEIFSATSIKLI